MKVKVNSAAVREILTKAAMPLVQEVAQNVADAGAESGIHLKVSQDDHQEERAGAAVHPYLLQDMRKVGQNPHILLEALARG